MDRVKLIILVGIPGSGKSTYAVKYMEENHRVYRLSSDDIRRQLYGDESIQGDPHEVFSFMQERAIAALNMGTDVVYDATNITRKDRASIISLCPKFVQIEAHVIWAPIETCIERDAARKRTVGKAVIDKMLKRFQPVYYDEGIDVIKVIKPSDFDMDNYALGMMNAMDIPHDNPHHSLNILDHCVEAYNLAIKDNTDINIQLAAFIHDVGKPYVKAFKDTKGNNTDIAHFYSHDNVGTWISYGMFEKGCIEIAWLVGNHMGPFMNTKYYNNLPHFLKKQIDLLHEYDLNAH